MKKNTTTESRNHEPDLTCNSRPCNQIYATLCASLLMRNKGHAGMATRDEDSPTPRPSHEQFMQSPKKKIKRDTWNYFPGPFPYDYIQHAMIKSWE